MGEKYGIPGSEGKIRTKEHSMGYAIFKWLQLRLGVNTVKPDVHVKKFVSNCIGRKAKDEETVEAVVIAKRSHACLPAGCGHMEIPTRKEQGTSETAAELQLSEAGTPAIPQAKTSNSVIS